MTKPKPGDPEAAIQRTFFQFVRMWGGPRLLCFSVPNEGRRSKRLGAKFKEQGLHPGAADVICLWNGKGILLEFKSKTGRQTKAQQDFQIAAMEAMWSYHVCRCPYFAYDLLEMHGAPLKWVHRDGRFILAEGRE